MKQFLGIKDVSSLPALLEQAKEVKINPLKWNGLGRGRSICLIFFNSSLRTRLSSIRAAENLGMSATVLDVNNGAWKLEFEDGTIMNGESAEHVKEAAGVIGAYFDMIAIRAFAGLKDKRRDYEEHILSAFVKYCGVPVINMESSTGHPLQSFADLLTIEEHKRKKKPKVVLTWVPHPRALPHAVANSFVEWMQVSDVELVVTHPEGYELPEEIMGSQKPEYDQLAALDGADFVYAKNWSSFTKYGQILSRDPEWMVTGEKMKHTDNGKFLHCLPVRRNVVVEDAVLDSSRSIVIEQAANRIVSMQTVLKAILERDS